MEAQELFAGVFVAGMFAGVIVIFLAMRQRAELLQMQHRERMAMIERGQVPLQDGPAARPGWARPASSRSMSLGIIVVGLGVALMLLIGVAADSPSIGVGVGGAIVIVGLSFVVRSLVVNRPVAGAGVPPVADPSRRE